MARRGKVLVVDDNDLVLALTRARLESAGFDVIAKQGPLGTLPVILKEKPDVVLLDVSMPALRGDRLAELINRQVGKVPIILFSSMAAGTLAQMADRVGALGVIGKTTDDKAFLAEFERLFGRVAGAAKP